MGYDLSRISISSLGEGLGVERVPLRPHGSADSCPRASPLRGRLHYLQVVSYRLLPLVSTALCRALEAVLEVARPDVGVSSHYPIDSGATLVQCGFQLGLRLVLSHLDVLLGVCISHW